MTGVQTCALPISDHGRGLVGGPDASDVALVVLHDLRLGAEDEPERARHVAHVEGFVVLVEDEDDTVTGPQEPKAARRQVRADLGGAGCGAGEPAGDGPGVGLGAPCPPQPIPPRTCGCRVGVGCSRLPASDPGRDRKSTRLNSSHIPLSRMPSSA